MCFKRVLSTILAILILSINIFSSSISVFADSSIIGTPDISSKDSTAEPSMGNSNTINNSAPAAGLSFSPKNKGQLVVNIGKTVYDDVNLISSKINSIVVPQLQSKSIDVQVSINKSVSFNYGKVYANSGNSAALAGDGSVYIWGYNENGLLGIGATDSNFHPMPTKVLSNCTDLSLGAAHGIALSAGGSVFTWGNPSNHALGDPSWWIPHYSPYEVPGLSGIVDVEARGYGCFAIKDDGTIYAWGSSFNGETGTGTFNQYVDIPTKVEGLTNVKTLACGTYHTLALLNDGDVYAWGKNYYGELGDGTTDNRSTPVKVPGLSDVIAIAAGEYHSVAVKSDGTVWTWGYNGNGELGDGTTVAKTTPAKVNGLAGIKGVAASSGRTLALHENGTVYGWGYNYYKQTSYTGANSIYTPEQVSELAGVKEIAAGQYHSLCVKEDGTVWGWGTGRYGSLGTSTASGTPPIPIKYTSGFKQIATGYYHTLALKEDGTVWTYGQNSSGQLGLGYADSNYVSELTKVPGLTDVIAVYASTYTSWALKTDGTLWGWGSNRSHLIGDGTGQDKYTPTMTTAASNIKDIGHYEGTVLAVRKDGSVVSWGDSWGGSDNVVEHGFNDIVDVAMSYATYHLLNNKGELWSWGYNSYGQVGDGTTNYYYSSAQRKLGLTNVKKIWANNGTVLALTNNNDLYVAGLSNRSYTWGIPQYHTFVREFSPCSGADVSNLVNAAIASSNGAVYMWGYDYTNGNMGYKQLSEPRDFGLRNAQQVSIGSSFTGALLKDGTVWHFGRHGQTYTYDAFIPITDGSNFKISGVNSVPLTDTLSNITWRPDSKHFFINISDIELTDLNDNEKLANVINILSTNNIEYAALGTGVNQAQAESLITQNGGNGVFIGNSNIDTALGELSNYVTASFSPKADVYINTVQNNITTVTGLVNNTLLPALKAFGINAKVTVNNGAGNTITQVLDTIAWRSSSKRFFVNISDIVSTELNTLAGTLLARNIFYCGFGTTANEAQINNLINQNAGRGLFFNNTNLLVAMNNLASYIDSQIDRTEASTYVLAGDAVTYSAFYNDVEIDPRYQARWKYIHDPYYFDNSNGIIPDSGGYRDFSYNTLDKVGKYTISYQVKDNPKSGAAFDEYRLWSDDTEFKTVIYVHRKPIAQFTAVVSYNSTLGYYIPTVADSSHDLDHTSRPDKGITNKTYQWKEINEAVWKDGLPASLSANKVYLIKLVVTDLENTQSDPCVRIIDTGAGNNPPVAQFVLSPNPVKINQTAVITDNSYDPDGNPIVERIWTLLKGDTQKYIGSEAPVSFGTWGSGDYTLKLKVKDSLGAWSKEFAQNFTVINDTLPPLLSITPTERDWANTNITVTVASSDIDSGIKEVKYCWTNSVDKPTTGWLTSSAGSFTSTQSAHGVWYFHAEAFDNSIFNNSTYISGGPYKIDKIAPTGTVSLTPSTWTNTNVTINITAADEGSGVNRIKLPSGNWISTESAEYSVSANGTYNFTIEDKAGNTRVVPAVVGNIDKIAPTGVYTPNSCSWTNSNVSVTFDPSDAGGSGVSRWRYRLSNDSGTTWGTWFDYIEGDTNGSINMSSQGVWVIQAEVSDNAGNFNTVQSGLYNIDKTAPSGTFIPDNKKWTYNNVSVIFDPSDTGGSGVNRWRYRTSTNNGSSWSAWGSYIIGDTNGSINISTQGIWVIQAEVSDNAGNVYVVTSGAYLIDKEKPSGIFTPNNQSWTKNNVAVTFDPSDAGGSGVYQWRYRTSSNNGSTWGAYGTYINGDTNGSIDISTQGIWVIQAEVSDNAGNTATVTSGSYYIDKTNPSGAFSPNSQGWTKNNVAVTFDPSDIGGSGVYQWRYRTSSNGGSNWGTWSAYTLGDVNSIINLTEGGSWKIQAEVTDVAGNSATVTSGTYNIDKILPTIAFDPASHNWTNSTIMVNIDPSDTGGSGVYQWRYRTSSNGGTSWGIWSAYTLGDVSGNIVLSAQGTWIIQAEVADNAGNLSTVQSGAYNIDKTAPSGTFTPNSCSWTNSNVSVIFDPSDTGGSGVYQWRYRTSSNNGSTWGAYGSYTNGDTNGSISITAAGIWMIQTEIVDMAGNIATVTSGTYYVDKTAPSGIFTPNSSSWTKNNVAVTFDPSDTGGSGVYQWRYRTSSNNGSTWGAYGSYINGDTNGTINLTSEGLWLIEAEVTDMAGNISMVISGLYRLDISPPSGSFIPGFSTWTNSNISVAFTPDDRGGSGVYRWRYRTSSNSGTTWSSWSVYTNGTASGNIVLNSQGVWVIQAEVSDNAGNVSLISSFDYYIDKTLPSGSFTPNSCTWTNQNVTVTFDPSDTGGSGVSRWRYRTSFDNGSSWSAWGIYINGDTTDSVNFTGQGLRRLQAEVTDNAGNVATLTSGTYQIDMTAPAVDANPTTLADSAVTVTITASDTGGSGVNKVNYCFTTSTAKPASGWSTNTNTSFVVNLASQGTFYLHMEVFDNAGNSYYRYRGPYTVNSPPAVRIDRLNPTLIYEGDDVTVNYTPSDPNNFDVLTSVLTLYKNGTQVWTNTQTINPRTGGGYNQVSKLIQSNISVGNYKLVIMVTDPLGLSAADEITFAVNALSISSSVSHTTLWDSNRQKYNLSKSGNSNSPRSYDIFFPGEKFLLKANTTVIDPSRPDLTATSVQCRLISYPYSNILVNAGNNLWSGEIWDGTMINWSDRTLTFEFTTTYSNGSVKTHQVIVKIVDDEYWRLNMLF